MYRNSVPSSSLFLSSDDFLLVTLSSVWKTKDGFSIKERNEMFVTKLFWKRQQDEKLRLDYLQVPWYVDCPLCYKTRHESGTMLF